jgi:uncharacterized SAM-binding protein YcdF (DUF218 family)
LQSRRTIIFIIIVLAAGIALIAGTMAYRNAGTWLIAGDPLPPRVDILFSFGGEWAREQYVRELAARYPAATVVVSTPGKSRFLRKARESGLDSARFVIVDTCSSTLSEIRFLGAFVKNCRGAAPVAGLVSGPYHMRRIRIIVGREWRRDTPAKPCYLPVPLERYGKTADDYRHWWRTADLRHLVTIELGKIAAYLAVRE